VVSSTGNMDGCGGRELASPAPSVAMEGRQSVRGAFTCALISYNLLLSLSSSSEDVG